MVSTVGEGARPARAVFVTVGDDGRWLVVGPAVPLPEVDVSRPHPVRVYDYWLGGKDHYAADRELGDAMAAELPGVAMMARAHRRFMQRAVRYLAGEAGLSQFLLLGSGLPSSYNLHQAVQEIEPSARVVYVDSDPVVAAHSRALLVSHAKGSVEFVPGDVADPAALLDDPALADVLDLQLPVALALASTLMRYPDETARRILDVLLDRLAPGSHVVLSHPTADFDPDAVARASRAGEAAGFRQSTRTRDQVVALFDGLQLVEPGVVPILDWRPDQLGVRPDPRSVHLLGGVGRKP